MHGNLYDNRFLFRYDRPFGSNTGKLQELRKYIAANHTQFIDVDTLNESRYKIVFPEQTSLYGVTDIGSADITRNPIIRDIREFIRDTDGISDALLAWANADDMQIAGDITASMEEVGGEGGKTSMLTGGHLASSLCSLRPTASNISYDCSIDKTIEYDELRQLCMNIAISKKFSNETDAITSALEEDRKKQLLAEIGELRNVRLIGAADAVDLAGLNIEQLEMCKERCEKLFETYKFSEVCKSVVTVASIAYDGIFPDGIQVRNVAMHANGIGDEILSTFLDPHTVTGLAFMRVLKKYGLNISNEAFLLLKASEKVLTKLEFHRIEPQGQVDEGLSVVRTLPKEMMKLDDDDEL
jgi:hypothetical protein